MNKDIENKELKEDETIESIVEGLDDSLNERENTRLGHIVNKFEKKGFAVLIIILSLILILPTGAIPGVPIIAGLIIITFAMQIIIGQTKPWIPKRIRVLKLNNDSNLMNSVIVKAKPIATKADKYIKPRMEYMFKPAVNILLSVSLIISSVLIMIVGIIPFAITLPSIAILFIGLGINARDGLFVLIGLVLTVFCSLALGYTLI